MEAVRTMQLTVLLLCVLLISGCPAGVVPEESGTKVVAQSPIAAGIYVAERQCNGRINSSDYSTSDQVSFTIDNDGLLVLHGETIHVGLTNTFDTSEMTQSSVIKAIAVTADGFTIDWDLTLTISDIVSTGYVQEIYKVIDANSFEFRSTFFATATQFSYWDQCSAVFER